jgi:hypothetical protein
MLGGIHGSLVLILNGLMVVIGDQGITTDGDDCDLFRTHMFS